MKKQIAHFTTVHSRIDTRICLKEAASLSHFFPGSVFLLVRDGLGSIVSESDKIPIIDVGQGCEKRFIRMTYGAWKMYRAVSLMKPTVAHFHDPELIPVGLLLRLQGIKVIYDVHEDVPLQIMTKHWIPLWLRRPLASLVNITERLSSRVFNDIITATPAISKRFPRHKTTVVQNYPLVSELLHAKDVKYSGRQNHIAYVGSISGIRGAREMVEALEFTDPRNNVRLQLAGSYIPSQLEHGLRKVNGWDRVISHGWLDRQGVTSLLANVRVGLVVFHPAPNHIDSQPNKLFEYMSAGLPIIASDFPLWREIVEGADCGLLVDPHDPEAIARAIDWLLNNPERAESMGQRGREAVETTYNWSSEAAKLVKVYERLLD